MFIIIENQIKLNIGLKLRIERTQKRSNNPMALDGKHGTKLSLPHSLQSCGIIVYFSDFRLLCVWCSEWCEFGVYIYRARAPYKGCRGEGFGMTDSQEEKDKEFDTNLLERGCCSRFLEPGFQVSQSENNSPLQLELRQDKIR